MGVKGFKAMNKNLKCREFKFAVGETYTLDGTIKLCEKGFHFCENPFDVYNYYPKEIDTIVCEVEALGDVAGEGDKRVTNKIKILRRLTDTELLKLWINKNNSGHYNSGHYNSGSYNSGIYNSGDCNSGSYNSGDHSSGDHNSGNRNSGDYNSGSYNSGDHNSGDRNSGNYNSGDYNSGNYNSGDYNSGNYNSGYNNSGHYNSGHYNSGHYNNGYFNTTTPMIRLFNKDTDLTFDSQEAIRIKNLPVKPILTWVHCNNMTEQEKKDTPNHAITGGFLRNSGRMSWDALTKEDLQFIKSLPNFDAEVFKQISGLDLNTPKTIKVMVDGKEFEIDIVKAKELGLIK